MKQLRLYFLLFILIAVNLNLYAWTSSNEGVCYTMDTLVQLSDSINYNDAGSKVSEGIYFYKLISQDELLVKKIILVK